MANVDKPFGLRLVGHLSGSPLNARTQKCYIKGDYATALYVGDPVVLNGTSNTAEVSTGIEKHKIGTLPEIEKATAGDDNPVVGAIVGFEPIIRSGTAPYNPASTERVALVCVDEDAIYQVQASGATGAALVGANANIVYTHGGSTTSGLSGAELNSASTGTTNTFQLKLLRVSTIPDRSDAASDNCVVEVKINRHQYGNVTVGL